MQSDLQCLEHLSCSELKVLDLRPASEFSAVRLVRSHNIPQDELKTRFFELPDRSTSFGVVCATPRGAQEWTDEQSGGWRVAFVLVATPALWSAAKELELCIEGPVSQTTLLFSPCPLLSQSIDQVEGLLPGPTQAAHCVGGPAGPACLDVGCGSGRDMIFLAIRGWTVHGLDNWKGAVKRARTAAANYGVAGLLSVSRVNITAEGAVDVLEASEMTGDLATAQHDLVLVVRFLNRGLYPRMRAWTRPGGCVLVSTFLEDLDAAPEVQKLYPKGEDHILRHGELAAEFGPLHGFRTITDSVAALPDGRLVSHFVAQKLPPSSVIS